jgi:hypothetical protein
MGVLVFKTLKTHHGDIFLGNLHLNGLLETLLLQTVNDVLQNCSPGEEGIILKDNGGMRLRIKVIALNDHLARGRAEEARDDIQQGRLSTTTGPHDHDKFILFYGEMDIPKSLGAASLAVGIDFRDMVD